MRRISLPTLLFAVVALTACAKPDACSPAAAASVPGGPANPKLDSATYTPALNVDLGAMTKSASGLYYHDVVVGCGEVAVPGKTVDVKYSGTLPDGTPFDAGNFAFILGARRVVPGWDEGIENMRVGGKRQLIVPPELGYGSQGNGPVPPNGIMVFSVELVSVK